MRRLPIAWLAVFTVGVLSASAVSDAATLRPLLETHRFKCHNADKKKGGVDLTA